MNPRAFARLALAVIPIIVAGVILANQSTRIASLRERLELLESMPPVKGVTTLEANGGSVEADTNAVSSGDKMLSGVSPATTSIDPESFYAEIESLGFSASEEEFMKVLAQISGVGAESLKALLDYDAPIEGEVRMLVHAVALQELARVDPESALEFLEDNDMGLFYLMAAIGEVVKTAPDVAIVWYEGISENAVAGGARDALTQAFAQSRPDRLMDFLNSLDDEKKGMSAAGAVSLAEPTDELVGSMLELAEDLESSVGQQVKTNLAASIAKYRGFEQAIEFLDSLDLPAGERGRAGLSIAVQSKDGIGEEQADWLLEDTRDAPNRLEIFPRLISEWARGDFSEAGNYLNEMAASPIRDKSVASFAFRIRDVEPPSATDWAITIEDRKLRHKTLDRIYQAWVKKNPAEAKAYFASAGIDGGE